MGGNGKPHQRASYGLADIDDAFIPSYITMIRWPTNWRSPRSPSLVGACSRSRCMTRSDQKTLERSTLDKILAALDVRLDQEPQPAETPDFFVMIGKRLIGIEITSYDSGR
jgi:hypothetical protein